jgi:hypothetical protein
MIGIRGGRFCAGADRGAATTATAVRNAKARAAGALRRALIGVAFSIMPINATGLA